MSLDPEIRSFLAAHIDDVDALEILLLLRRKPEPWAAEAVARHLDLDEPPVADRLVHLCSIGLLGSETGERFHWAPKSKDLERVVEKLAAAYRSNRRPVLDEIAPRDVQSFSDAFRLRGKKGSNG